MIRHRSGQLDDPSDGDGQAQGRPTREDVPPAVEDERRLGHSARIHANFEPDLLELLEGQPILIRHRDPGQLVAGNRKVEDLFDLLISVFPFVGHVLGAKEWVRDCLSFQASAGILVCNRSV